MANKMLIDSTHPEETRVVVVRGNRVEEFDFESQSRKQLRGNIYLAKVTRVEPSLQAAFVEYGGNRHGFLAFSEIHPDYYQIPMADREALLAEEERAARAEAEADNRGPRTAKPAGKAGAKGAKPGARKPRRGAKAKAADTDAVTGEVTAADEELNAAAIEAAEAEAIEAREADADEDDEDDDTAEEETVEQVGAGDVLEDMPDRVFRPRRSYKIQEVIKRRQVMLVQVVKEERGNKGAALTTYLSLAGRYSVLMPNTARGGGISRKITNATDRKRLKSVATELEVPEGMGVILRTAGANRTKAEIKRDFEYLLRLWENVRDLTLKSSAPQLVYEEGSLIKRSIRDLYNKDIEEVQVAGDDGYREAKDFMRMLMPSHAKNVKLYRDDAPLFSRSGVETQLDAMFSPTVQLKSGGYIVINQTEALVSIDVNSGRATREHNIEDTALKTNLEAAEEVARQLRLRDLAGLVVIDFIDMEEKRNNRSVEKRLKEHLKNDRARIQVGRISHFGLLEMSRQRIRTGVLESSVEVCPHCGGTGHVRSVSSVALHLLRALEDQLIKSATHNLVVRTRAEVALYVLNSKRSHLVELEHRFGVTIRIEADGTVGGQQMFVVERGELATPTERPQLAAIVKPDTIEPVEPEDDAVEADGDEDEADEPRRPRAEAASAEDSEGNRRRRRRRRRRGGRGGEEGGPAARGAPEDGASEAAGDDAEDGEDDDEAGDATPGEAGAADDGAAERRRRRRGRRGGRRNRREGGPDGNGFEAGDGNGNDAAGDADDTGPAETAGAGTESAVTTGEPAEADDTDTEGEGRGTRRRRQRRPRGEREPVAAGEAAPAGEAVAQPAPAPTPAPVVAAAPAPEPAPVKARRSTVRVPIGMIVPASATVSEAPAAGEAAPAETPVALAPAETVEATAPPAPVEAPVEAAPAAAPEAAADEGKPRKSGWWSRGKAIFGG